VGWLRRVLVGWETTASRDVYTFSVPAGGQSVVFDSVGYSFALRFYNGSQLIRVSDGPGWVAFTVITCSTWQRAIIGSRSTIRRSRIRMGSRHM